MPTPLISFIVITYNLPPEMIRECLESILSVSLTPEEREVILIDDGSENAPLNGLSDISNEIIYLRQHNQGPSAARNKGMEIANGKYIQFVDGDDFLIPAPYNYCLDIVKNQDPDIVLFANTKKHRETSQNSFRQSKPETGSSFMYHHNLRSAACGYIFKHHLIATLRYSVGLLHEDEEFTPLLFLRAEKIITTNAKAYYYRMRHGSTTQNNAPLHLTKRLSDLERIIVKLHDLKDTLPTYDQQALGRRIAQLSMDYLYNTIRLTRSPQKLNEAIAHLRKHGLYPLPDKRYTSKYKLFRATIGNKLGRKALLLILPRL